MSVLIPIIGTEIKPWRDGTYRCPFHCHPSDSPYPQRSWRSDAGILKHMAACDLKPLPDYHPPTQTPIELYGTCECGRSIYEGDPVYMVGDHEQIVCFYCRHRLGDQISHMDCAGLRFPDDVLAG